MNMVLEYEILSRRQEQMRVGEKRLRQLLGDVQTLPAIDDAPSMLGHQATKPGSWLKNLRVS
jgi:hypothetical protein